MAVMIFLVVCGLFIPLIWVFILIILWRIHLLIFHGCFLTILEQKEGAIPRGKGYIWLATKRFFGIRLSHTAVKWVSRVEAALGLAIAVVANIWHIRLHL